MFFHNLRRLVATLGLMSLALMASDANAMAGSCCRTCTKTCTAETPQAKPAAGNDCCCDCKSCRKCCPMVCPEPKPCEPYDCRCLNQYKPNEMWNELNGTWHNPRHLNDFNPDEFHTIMLQMRVLGKMPGGHVRKVVKFFYQQ